jgi:hypothetical protein
MYNSISNIIMKVGRMRLNFAETGIQYNNICPKYKNSPPCGVKRLLFGSNYFIWLATTCNFLYYTFFFEYSPLGQSKLNYNFELYISSFWGYFEIFLLLNCYWLGGDVLKELYKVYQMLMFWGSCINSVIQNVERTHVISIQKYVTQ